MNTSQPLAYTLSGEHNKGHHGRMVVSRSAVGGQGQVSPSNFHCLCLGSVCRTSVPHLLAHSCELLQPQLTGRILKKGCLPGRWRH